MFGKSDYRPTQDIVTMKYYTKLADNNVLPKGWWLGEKSRAQAEKDIHESFQKLLEYYSWTLPYWRSDTTRSNIFDSNAPIPTIEEWMQTARRRFQANDVQHPNQSLWKLIQSEQCILPCGSRWIKGSTVAKLLEYETLVKALHADDAAQLLDLLHVDGEDAACQEFFENNKFVIRHLREYAKTFHDGALFNLLIQTLMASTVGNVFTNARQTVFKTWVEQLWNTVTPSRKKSGSRGDAKIQRVLIEDENEFQNILCHILQPHRNGHPGAYCPLKLFWICAK